MKKQQVHLGKTRSGVPGLFTGNTLALHISEEQFETFSKARGILSVFVEKQGFELEDDDEPDEPQPPTRGPGSPGGHWEICDHCEGSGKSSAYLGAFTKESLNEAFEDGGEAYMRGAYDRLCPVRCKDGKIWIEADGTCEARERFSQSREDQRLADKEDGIWDGGMY